MEIIKLNLIPSGVNPICHAKQYDEGRIIRFMLFDGLTPYTLQSGDTVTLNLRKPDNTIIESSVTATQGNKYVDLVTTEQICAVAGYNLGTFKITNGSVEIGTLNFIMEVGKDVLANGIPSQSVIDDLDELVQAEVDAQLGDNYYNKAQTNTLLNSKANSADVYTKTDLNALTEIASFNQLLDKDNFIAGKKLQTTALVSTPEDMVDDPYYTVTNIIELDWATTEDNRTLETNLKAGEFVALGYILRNGQYVRSAYVTAVTQVGDHYKFDIPVANAKLRLSIYSQVVDVSKVIITKEGEWTNNTRYGKNIAILKDKTVYVENLSTDLRNALIPTNPCLYKGNSAKVFKNILCIGDSLTEGAFNYGPNGQTGEFIDSSLAYPEYLKALTGRNTYNAGDSGQSTKTWWNIHQNDDLSGYDACIIELGLNDVSGREEVRCTSVERIAAMNNIISKLKSENTGIKIFISSVFNVARAPSQIEVNNDLKTIANTTNDCYFIDLQNYGTLTNDLPDRFIHLTAIGYKKFAQEYFNYMSYIIDNSTPSEFAFVQFIGTNYTPT